MPFVLDAATFAGLATGIVERVEALERILADLYGPRTLVADGVVPGEQLSSTPRYRLGSVGSLPPRRWLTTYAADVVQLGDGSWHVVRDLADAPAGIGYALLDRAAMLPVDDAVASLSGVAAVLRRALFANTSVVSPRIVLLTGGVEHSGYVEDSQLARLLGFTLVERPDLVVRQGRLWLRIWAPPRPGSLGGLDPIDVVYRRVEDDETDSIELAATPGAGVPGVLSAVASGGVVLANAHGSGLIEEPAVAPYWWPAAEALTGSSLRLPLLDEVGTDRLRQVPSFRDGELAAAAVVLRLHALVTAAGVTVVPGGNGRVLAAGDDPRRPSARLVKDVWVLDRARSLPAVVTPLPQVDLAASVPTRAADALFWMGRSAERAGAIARTLRVIAGHRRQDPMLVTIDGGWWTSRVTAALIAVSAAAVDSDDARRAPVHELEAVSMMATQQLGERLRAFVADAASVGEFLSGGTARVLANLAALFESFAGGRAAVETVDDVLAALAAFAGMWSESTVRGPAWRFGDIGIRLERALVVLGLAGSLIGDDGAADENETGAVAALEVLLAANESLVAYRRRYRSDVALGAGTRAASCATATTHGASSRACSASPSTSRTSAGSAEGRLSASSSQSVTRATADELASPAYLDAVGAAVGEFAAEVVATWFATPVKPMLMRAGRAALS